MSMSTATKYASYIAPVIGDMLDLEIKAKGLATTFHEKVQLIMTEVFKGRAFDGKEAGELYAEVCLEVEKELANEVEKHFGKGVSLSEAVKNWRQYKSIYKNGMKMGLNPADYPTFSKFKQAKDGGGSASTEGKKGNNSTTTNESGGGSSNNTDIPASVVPDITSELSPELRGELNVAIAALTKLYKKDPDAAAKAVEDMTGACYHKLRQAGGRFAHAGRS